MGLISRLFGGGARGRGAAGSSGGGEHAVKLVIAAGADGIAAEEGFGERVYALEDRLIVAIEARGAGELDGDEFGESGCVILMYGPDAEGLWEAIAPVLETERFAAGSHAIKRYGGPGAREERVDLEWAG